MEKKLNLIVIVNNSYNYKKIYKSFLLSTYKNFFISFFVDLKYKNIIEHLEKKLIKKNLKFKFFLYNNEQTLLQEIKNNVDFSYKYFHFLKLEDSFSNEYFRKIISNAEKSNSDIVISPLTKNKYKYINQQIYECEIVESDCYEFFLNIFSIETNSSVFNKLFISKYLKQSIEFFLVNFNKSNFNFYEQSIFFILYFAKKTKKISFIYDEYIYTRPRSINVNYLSIINELSLLDDFNNDNFLNKIKQYVAFSDVNNNEKMSNNFNTYCKNLTKFINRKKIINKSRTEKLKKIISKKNVISFDVFDTLLIRNLFSPSDLFFLLSYEINKKFNNNKFLDFHKIRILAEKNAREIIKGEITINDIYDELIRIVPFLKEHKNEIIEMEMQLEINVIESRKFMKEIYEYSVSLNKTIIVISDMYMSKNNIHTLLEKNGYKIPLENIYVSSELKKTKYNGDIYNYVLKERSIKKDDILHIGDDKNSDILNAKKNGISSFFVPKIIDIFTNKTKLINNNLWCFINSTNNKQFIENKIHNYFWIRTFLSIIANYFFDNPFLHNNKNNLFINPFFVGYGCLGMHIFSVLKWVINNTKTNQKIFFNMRDGYLYKKCLEIINKKMELNLKIDESYFSREFMLPFFFKDDKSILMVNDQFSSINMNNTDIFLALKNFIAKDKIDYLLNQNKLKIDNDQKSYNFINQLIEEKIFIDEKAFPISKIKKQYEKKFSNQIIFDIGYSSRISSFFKNIFDINIVELLVYSMNDVYFHRKNQNKNKTLFYSNLNVNKICTFREIMVSKISPKISSMLYLNDAFEYIPDNDYFHNPYNYLVINRMQNGAINFIEKIINIFNEYFFNIDSHQFNFDLPLEYYLNFSNKHEREFFKFIQFENNFDWKNVKRYFGDVYKNWLKENKPKKFNNNSNLLILLFRNKYEFASKINELTKRNKILNDLLKYCYYKFFS